MGLDLLRQKEHLLSPLPFPLPFFSPLSPFSLFLLPLYLLFHTFLLSPPLSSSPLQSSHSSGFGVTSMVFLALFLALDSVIIIPGDVQGTISDLKDHMYQTCARQVSKCLFYLSGLNAPFLGHADGLSDQIDNRERHQQFLRLTPILYHLALAFIFG